MTTNDDATEMIRVLRVIADEQFRTNAFLERLVKAGEKKIKPAQADLLPSLTPQEMVEHFELDPDLIAWGREKCASVPLGLALEDWKLRMASVGYAVSGKAVKNVKATFQTYCRNAEKWGDYRKGKPLTHAATSRAEGEKSL